MVEIYPETINFLVFWPEKVKYYPEKLSAQIFEKFTQKIKFAQWPSPANQNMFQIICKDNTQLAASCQRKFWLQDLCWMLYKL